MLTPTREAKILKSGRIRCLKDVKQKELLDSVGGSENWCKHFGSHFGK